MIVFYHLVITMRSAFLQRFFLVMCLVLCSAIGTAHAYTNLKYETPEGYEGWDLSKVRTGKLPYKVIFYGDSVMSGYGLAEPKKKSVTALIARDFTITHYVDRGVLFKDLSDNGETTANSVTRIKQAIALKPDILVLAIGTNDAIRGVDPDVVYNNLEIILRDLARSGVYTLFVGMQANKDMGYDYLSKFNSTYAKLAQKYNVVFMPYLKQDVSGNRMLMQRDGIYPNAEGALLISQNMSKHLAKMFKLLKNYHGDLDEIAKRKKYMQNSNKMDAMLGRPPRFTQEEIDAVGRQ
jgi:acyl-CoA thioesterase I